MFDIGFTELMLIGVVALLVVGPERLPKLARTAGQWLGRLNRYVSQVKQDVSRDMQLEELRKMQQEMKDSAQKYEILAGDAARQVEETVEQETSSISKVMQAMSLTDGGLTMQEYEKVQAEKLQGENPQSEASKAEKAVEKSAAITVQAPAQPATTGSAEEATVLTAANEEAVAKSAASESKPV
jgi:sec-independent protein translocase protein TatB